jgi:acetyl-CoA carboxylase beta subunit
MKGLTPEQKMVNAEKRIKSLLDSGDLKRLKEEKDKISKFYERKSLNRIETAASFFLIHLVHVRKRMEK